MRQKQILQCRIENLFSFSKKEREKREERQRKWCQSVTQFFTKKADLTDESAAPQSPHICSFCTPPCPSEEGEQHCANRLASSRASVWGSLSLLLFLP
ncbi:hypothetical protein DPEC_G00085970 [Dallia pectoralis]|uniref:Uncharacterized protein n=1 Tax=Dallia pectoralis TaxID=75939 RepID=A0ACC2H0B3_DALPE|nr:hypothetical protein DPEC_G00085970 [Dallia pectoralis]